MTQWTLRRILPRWLKVPLWGDRQRWGLTANTADPCWQKWQKIVSDFYITTQRQGIGTQVNDAGYRVMKALPVIGKTVLEIGAGDIRHLAYWRGKPALYLLADVHPAMMAKAQRRLQEQGVNHQTLLLERGQSLPLPDASVDAIVSFYSLEHLYPLMPYLREMRRVLKPDGILIGAIPAEGGLAWGLGRLLTSRRWFKQNTTIDPDKIICWEHPNFADDVLSDLDHVFQRRQVTYWPFPWLRWLDCNLILRFCYQKKKS